MPLDATSFHRYDKSEHIHLYPSGYSDFDFEASLFDILRLSERQNLAKIYTAPFVEKDHDYVVISSSLTKENEPLAKVKNIDTYKDWDNFRSSAKQLKNGIEKWLQKYLSKNVNLSS